MKKHELQDERLDEAGRKLLELSRIPHSELERIISAPHLFSAIKNRVRAEEAKPAAGFDWRAVFLFLAQPNAAAAFAALLIAVFAFGGFYLYSRQAGVATNISQPKMAKKPEQVALTSSPGDSGPSRPTIDVANATNAETPAQPGVAIYRPAYKAEPSTARVSYRKKAREAAHYESDGEFYPLTFTGGSNEIAPGAQIVRVELPRSSLFSMGVDLADDNRTGTVKADLLISSDGVARGFRLVK